MKLAEEQAIVQSLLSLLDFFFPLTYFTPHRAAELTGISCSVQGHPSAGVFFGYIGFLFPPL